MPVPVSAGHATLDMRACNENANANPKYAEYQTIGAVTTQRPMLVLRMIHGPNARFNVPLVAPI